MGDGVRPQSCGPAAGSVQTKRLWTHEALPLALLHAEPGLLVLLRVDARLAAARLRLTVLLLVETLVALRLLVLLCLRACEKKERKSRGVE